MVERLQAATLGEFIIERELGRGGMAAVFLAHEVRLGRHVAIKVMSPELLLGQGMLDRFRQEARTVASLSHPHIITIHSVREVDDLHFFVMKFVAGRSLDHIVQSVGALPVSVVRAIVFQVGSALAYAHRKGVVHRDVKPGNILLDTDGNAIVTDFGIAKVVESTTRTQTGSVVGTANYMSPEQCYARPVSPASDQYSLGIVAYQLLTGRVPFVGSSFEVMQAHTDKAVPPIRDARPDCPPEFEAAVLRMLEKDPAHRWPGMPNAIAAIGGGPLGEGDPLRDELAVLAAPQVPVVEPGPLAAPLSPAPASLRASMLVSPIDEAPCVLTVTAPSAPLEVGETAPLVAVVRTESGDTLPTRRVAWKSNAPDVVAIDDVKNVVVALSPGTASIVARAEACADTGFLLTVIPARAALLAIAAPQGLLRVGDRVQLAASLRDQRGTELRAPIAWSSSNARVASMSAEGVLTGKNPGIADITAQGGGLSASVRVEVSRAAVASIELRGVPSSVRMGDTFQLRALPLDAAGSPVEAVRANWMSSNSAIASVKADGRVTAHSVGAVEVTVVCEEQVASATVTVAPAVADSPGAPAARRAGPAAVSTAPLDPRSSTPDDALAAEPSGTQTQPPSGARPWFATRGVVIGSFAALVVFGFLLTQFGRTREPAATVDQASPPSAVAPAAVDQPRPIAPSGPGVGAAAPVTANARPSGPDSSVKAAGRRATLVIEPTTVTTSVGDSMRLSPIVVDTAGKSASVNNATWRSDNSAVATVSSRGVVRGMRVGSTSVIATAPSLPRFVVSVKVGPAAEPPPRVLAAATLQITQPNPSSAAPGDTIVLTAVARSATGEALPGRVTWRSNNPAVAQVDPRTGIVRINGEGSAEIAATADGITRAVNVVGKKPAIVGNVSSNPGGAASSNADASDTKSSATVRVARVAAGGAATCVIGQDAGVFCWGASQLTPTPVGGMKFSGLTIGRQHRCGLSGEVVYCWGANDRGQLGEGTSAAKASPAAVKSEARFVSVTAGGSHTCALDAAGKAYCWGLNDMGQLGNGSTRNANAPVAVKSDVAFRSIEAGRAHTCGLTAAGKAYCWGDGWSGALGNGIRDKQVEPYPVDANLTFKKLAAGDEHTCGLTSNGEAYCWGDNRTGQLGDARKEERVKPSKVARIPAFGDIVAGSYFTCGLTPDGRVFCWGSNTQGQLGNGTTANRPTPGEVAGDQTFQSISAGSQHACGVTTGRTLLCWGDNSRGQLGTGTTTAQPNPTPVMIRPAS